MIIGVLRAWSQTLHSIEIETGVKKVSPCFVYVIGPKAGPYKIGISRDINKRLRDLGSGSPVRLFLMWKQLFSDRVDARAVEAELHNALASSWSHGEWFDIPLEEAILAVQAMRTVRGVRRAPSEIQSLARKFCAPEYAEPVTSPDPYVLNRFRHGRP
jgi:predicted GIY-YIG superfamily endonuclease